MLCFQCYTQILFSASPFAAVNTAQPPSIVISKESPNPQLGAPYTLSCMVGTPGLGNSDITWVDENDNEIMASSTIMISDVEQINGLSVRNITFSPFSTANTGGYMCKTLSNTATTTLTPNGMILIIYVYIILYFISSVHSMCTP